MIIYILIFLVSIIFILSKTRPDPIHGVYEQAGYLGIVKQIFMYIIIRYVTSIIFKIFMFVNIIRLRKRKVEHKAVGHNQAWLGLAAEDDISIMESPRPLVDHPLACDAVWFGGGSKDGTCIVLSGARRKNNILQSMVFIYIPGVGLLRHKNHPETAMVQTEDDKEGWSGGGVSLVPEEPMRRWSVKFEGKMKNLKTNTEHFVRVDAKYTSSFPHFDFDSEMDPWTVARAMSREPWSREYFDRLKAAHQNHYEQFGDVTGAIEIDDVKHPLCVQVMKDHTHGSIRDWKLLHRYCFHQFCTLSGLRGFLGVVSQPGTLSHIEMGWIYHNGQKFAVQDCDLQPWNLGEGGRDAGDYGFRFRAGGRWFSVQVAVRDEERGLAFFGEDWESRVVERFCRYTIDGEEGWGVSEWQYRNKISKEKLNI